MSRPFKNLESTGPLHFDCLVAVCWFVHMRSDITSPRVNNISPGQLYTFVFTQDAIGGHTMNWPPTCINAAPIDPAPLSVTTQNFVGDIGGTMIANLPPSGVQP